MEYNATLQELKRQEDHEGFVGKPRRPRVIVLSPTRELTDQIAGVARQLSHHAKLRTVALSTGIKCVPPSASVPLHLLFTFTRYLMSLFPARFRQAGLCIASTLAWC